MIYFHTYFINEFPLITDAALQEHLFSDLEGVCVCAVDAPQMKKSKKTLKCEIHYLCECISVSMATTLGIAEQRRIR